jgi:hypothetical protein
VAFHQLLNLLPIDIRGNRYKKMEITESTDHEETRIKHDGKEPTNLVVSTAGEETDNLSFRIDAQATQ